LRKIIADSEDMQSIRSEYNIDANSAKEMKAIISTHKEGHIVPDDKTLLIENYKDFVIIHSCFGSLVNSTLSKYMASIITAETGIAVNIKSDPYRIMIQAVVKSENVEKILKEANNVEKVLETSLDQSSMLKHRFIQVAKRFGAITKTAQFEKISLNRLMPLYANTPIYAEAMRELMLEKMDLKRTLEVIERIKSGKVKIKIQTGLSVLGEYGLVHQFSEVMKPRMPESEIFNAFSRRLMATRVRLLCVNCGEYNLIRTVSDLDEQPECPKCTSRLIAILRSRQSNAVDIVKKKLKKKELTKDELKELQGIRRSSDLTIIYGKKAAIVMAGHGIGPQTAARILSSRHVSQEKLLKDVFMAEKEFLRTKPYWK
jgi:ATP-dependent Lhr-like helicase